MRHNSAVQNLADLQLYLGKLSDSRLSTLVKNHFINFEPVMRRTWLAGRESHGGPVCELGASLFKFHRWCHSVRGCNW